MKTFNPVQELLIYTPNLTRREDYVFSLFFRNLYTINYRHTQELAEFKLYKGPKFNYSSENIDEELFFKSAGLLAQCGLETIPLMVEEWNGLKIFYHVDGGRLPFDIFSASFYLVSRFEEYLPFTEDEHERFPASESIAYKYNFLHLPLVNLWAKELLKILRDDFPLLIFKENTYSFIPTIDVDVAYQHLGRKWFVTIGSVLKGIAKADFSFLADKTLTLLRIKKDKYDTYDYLKNLFKRYGIHPLFFILAGDRSAYDKNISTESDDFSILIKEISSYAIMGIHPSYNSNSNPEMISSEISRVEKHLTYSITASRQHYLRINMPETFRCLALLGIKDEYSMVYADQPGFRASIAIPYPFYDLLNEKKLDIIIHSTVFMDSTFNNYLKIQPEEAKLIIKKLIDIIKECKGEFIFIWHNQNLVNENHWKNWNKVFEYILEEGV